MKYIDIILYHLSPDSKGFISELYDEWYFNLESYNELLYAIKQLRGDKEIYDDKIIFNFIDRQHLLYNYLTNMKLGNYKLNIEDYQYADYLEELYYEIKSLYRDDWSTDFNGNKYKI